MPNIYANTTTTQFTHFPAALGLIQQAREDFKIPSENWPHPTDIRFGMPKDHYYAEVWVDGMDWQPSYWIIESASFNKPICYPLILFAKHDDREKFHEFGGLCKACMYYRRDIFWIQKDSRGYYNDTIWSYFHICDPIEFRIIKEKEDPRQDMIKCYMQHASQPKIEFFMNIEFIDRIDRNILPLLIHKEWSHKILKEKFLKRLKEPEKEPHNRMEKSDKLSQGLQIVFNEEGIHP